MKYIFLYVTLFFLSLNVIGQTLVSTEIESRKAVLEDFTGIHCPSCPDGHARAKVIKEEYPDDFFIINHHTGFFATPQNDSDPNFVTIYGAGIAQRSQLIGYPAGTINRHNFPGFSMNDDEPDATAQYKHTWDDTTPLILEEDSYVNMGVEANWDYETNEITVHVEAYYTGNSPGDVNYMNIALLQDSTFHYQIGEGSHYNHSNRLVDFITPFDGRRVKNITQGSFYDETFTYIVPAYYHNIAVDIANLKIVVFMAEGYHEIETGAECQLTYTNIPGHDVSIFEIEEIIPNCSGTLVPKIKIRNNAGAEITSLDFEYNVEGEQTHYYHWTGALSSYEKTIITLPEFSFDLEDLNDFKVSINTSDDDVSNNYSEQNFIKDTPTTVNHEVITVEVTDQFFGDEITWVLLNSSDEVILSGGPYESFDATLHIASTTLVPASCYNFFIYDTEADGISPWNGFYNIKIGDEIIVTGNDFGSKERIGIKTADELITSNIELLLEEIRIFPNPAFSQINVKNAEGMTVELFDMVGRRILKIENISNQESIDVSNFKDGLYIVKYSNRNKSKSEKIMIFK